MTAQGKPDEIDDAGCGLCAIYVIECAGLGGHGVHSVGSHGSNQLLLRWQSFLTLDVMGALFKRTELDTIRDHDLV